MIAAAGEDRQLSYSITFGEGQPPAVSPLDRTTVFTRFPDQFAFKKKEITATPREMAACIPEITADSKEELPFFKLARFGNVRTDKNCLRHDANVLEFSGVEGDHDAGTMTPQQACDLCEAARIAAVIYTTPSHGQPGKGSRWRGWGFVSEPLPPARRAAMLARLNGVLRGALTSESFALSQAFFAGSVNGRPSVEVLFSEGDYLDLRDDLDAGAMGKPGRVPSADREGGGLDEEAALEAIRTGAVLHPPMTALAGLWSTRGMPWAEADRRLREAMAAVPEAKRDNRWRSRMKEIPVILAAIYGKRIAERVGEAEALAADLDLMAEESGIVAEVDTPIDAEALARVGEPAAPARSKVREVADRQAEWGDVWAGARHADRLRGKRLYVSATKQSLAWNGTRWTAQTAQEVAADAKDTTGALLVDAAKAFAADQNAQTGQALAKARKLHASAEAQKRMIDMARSEPGMHVASPEVFDCDRGSLTCHNGILDLRTGRVREARPEDYVSKLAGAAFDPAARAPLWKRYLETVLPDPEVRAFVQRAAGFTLTGFVDEERFFLVYGGGQNGKSVFANIIAAVMGDYAASFPAALVTRNKHENEAERAKARLPGVRLALVDETDQGDVFDAARLKALASREKIAARRLYGEGFDFYPSHKLWIRTNHLPGSFDASDGFWRRCTPIPFTVQIPESERVADLDKRIIATELPGVLAWIVAGAMEWARVGLRIPEPIRREAQAYREDTDLLGQWLSERTRLDPGEKVRIAEAFCDYEGFCESLGASAGTAMTFSRAMTARGVKRDPDTSVRRFTGIRIVRVIGNGLPDPEHTPDLPPDLLDLI